MKDGLLFVEKDPYFALDDSFAHFTPNSASLWHLSVAMSSLIEIRRELEYLS